MPRIGELLFPKRARTHLSQARDEPRARAHGLFVADDGGTATTQLIRSGATSARNPQIPIVAITAHALQINADDCMLAGMNDYVTKPVSADALRQIVRRWIMPEKQPDEAGEEIPATCALFADRSRSPG